LAAVRKAKPRSTKSANDHVCAFCKKAKKLQSFDRVVVFVGMKARPVTEKVKACSSCIKQKKADYKAMQDVLTNRRPLAKLKKAKPVKETIKTKKPVKRY
jgi:hypothetical protein